MNTLFNHAFIVAFLLTGSLLIGCGEPDQDYKNDDDDRSVEAIADQQAATDADSNPNAYPRDEVLDDTNLEEDDYLPMEIGDVTSWVEKRELLALLLRQKNDMNLRINELENMPGDASDNTIIQGDIDKLRAYLVTLDREIVEVRRTQPGAIAEVVESALGTVKGAGALMQSSVMRIDRGF